MSLLDPIGEAEARSGIPERDPNSNKSSHGRALIFAGHDGMWGAGILATRAAYRIGAGYVTWASDPAPIEGLAQVPEALTMSSRDPALFRKEFSAITIGPGFGVTDHTAELLRELRRHTPPVVVDADAIATAKKFDLFPLPAHWVITPHSGELANVLGWEVSTVEHDRLHAARLAQQKVGAMVLLKGYRSVLQTEHGPRVVQSGNAALAKAGTGDVLTGMIVGLLAQGVTTESAVATAAYLHGRIADEWVASGQDVSGLNASDIPERLPELIARLRNS